jgi:hypothetical protein
MGRALRWKAFFWGEEAFWEEDFCEGIWVEMAGVRSLALGAFGESEAGGAGLLGVLGTGARIPFGFLELGSRTGCS